MKENYQQTSAAEKKSETKIFGNEKGCLSGPEAAALLAIIGLVITAVSSIIFYGGREVLDYMKTKSIEEEKKLELVKSYGLEVINKTELCIGKLNSLDQDQLNNLMLKYRADKENDLKSVGVCIN